jgi:hypothetical protein
MMRTMERRTRRIEKARPFKRLLHFAEGDVWSYQVASGAVLIRTPDLAVTHSIPLPEVVGMTYDEIEKGCWKKWWAGVGPGDVKAYVVGHLRGPETLELPPGVFMTVNKYWEPERWHLFETCGLLYRCGQPSSVADAEQRLGTKLTRKNLCGACRMRRDWKASQ